jgi:hypothetical protein
MRARGIPHVGDPVVVVFLAASVRGVVEEVDGDLRGLEVRTEEDETLRFELSRVSGSFRSGGQTGARLYFGEPAEP